MCFRKKKKVEKPVVAETKKEEKVVAAPAKKNAPKKAKPAPQKEEKKVEVKETTPKKEATRVYHVAKREEDGKWTVKFAGGKKVIKTFDTKKEAEAYTKTMAENQDGVMLFHKSKGANKGKLSKK